MLPKKAFINPKPTLETYFLPFYPADNIFRHYPSQARTISISLPFCFVATQDGRESQPMSTPQSDFPMVECCHICGDVGKPDDILICPKCKTSREHFYCRKIYSVNRTDDWCCDECERKGMGSSKEFNKKLCKTLASDPPGGIYDKLGHSALHGKNRKAEKKATKGKVKCISSHEAMTLSSGGSSQKRGKTLVKTYNRVTFSSSINERPMSQSPPIHRKSLSLTSPMTSVPLPLKRPTKPAIQQGSQMFRVTKEREAVRANRREIQMDEILNISDHERPTDIELNAPNYSKLPAYASWKGQFDVQGDDFHHTSSGYLASTRARCKRKLFEFYKGMPKLLKCKLIPREGIWWDLFKGEFYGEDEIGLYFFSGGIKRSDDDFLLKFIEAHDLAMRCDIGEVELYVFTSKLLPADYQRMYGEYYFWGVLRKPSKHNNVCGALRGSSSSTTTPASPISSK